MKIRLAADLQIDSIVDGEGIRTVVWTQGCPHKCVGCHNPSTHNFNCGVEVDVDDIIYELSLLKNQDGITLSGGDPVFQSDACYLIAKAAHDMGMNVWCYTGYTYEVMLKNTKYKRLLSEIDILVDGKFDIQQFSLNLQYKGSKNQRVIDVGESLKKGEVVLIDKYIPEKDLTSTYRKPEYIFI